MAHDYEGTASTETSVITDTRTLAVVGKNICINCFNLFVFNCVGFVYLL
jgi:hypothetical protein